MKKKDVKKVKYSKPVLTKHKKLKDITAGTFFSRLAPLGCTKF